MSYTIGIDLGGTKVEVIALSDTSDILFRHRVPTPQGNYTQTLDSIVKLVTLTETQLKAPAQRIGIGIPGAVSPATGLIKNANSTCLIGHQMDQDLHNLIGRPVKLANDADCFTLSEASDGAAAGYSSVFGVILGTGVGGGIVINRTLIQGPNAICGEWGHNPLPWLHQNDRPGTLCYCGKQDCIETFLSGPGFSKRYAEQYGFKQSSQAIWQAFRKGDTQAEAHCTVYFDQLARALASVINILDPEIIVLGGGMSNVDELYEKLPLLLGKYVFSDHIATTIVKAKFGDSSGVRGAAWL